MRYNTSSSDNLISLDDYISSMKEGQEKIYFLVAPTKQISDSSPFLEQFKVNNVPVLLLSNHIDEVCFKQIEKFKGHSFTNIESSYDQVSKDLGKKIEVDSERGLPEEDTTTFSLWMKAELEPAIKKVTISQRLSEAPCIVVGQVSSSMRAVLAMVDQSQFEQMSKD